MRGCYARIDRYVAGRVDGGARDEVALEVEELELRGLPDQLRRPALVAHARELDDDLVAPLLANLGLERADAVDAAADDRDQVTPEDLSQVAVLALRARRSNFMSEYFADQQVEEEEIQDAIQNSSNK